MKIKISDAISILWKFLWITSGKLRWDVRFWTLPSYIPFW